ncbi:MAG: heme o synthase [Kiloniellales bacterium]|nr:heme o synthase [Kiloniellales bacterium]
MSDLSIELSAPSPAKVVTSSAFAQSQVADYVALLKPRVMSLVVFTGFAGLMVAPGALHPLLAAVAVLCIAVASGAAGAINMWYDRDIDAVMSRTAGRPIPAGRVPPAEALAFGTVLSLFSVMLMGLAVNWTAAALLATATGFYVFVYTVWLKRRTPQNIVIGGAAGAFPPMIGWAAATGSVSLEAVALFLLIFVWTPPHFWALALVRDQEYAEAGVPMLPVVAGKRATRRQILIYALLLWVVALLPCLIGSAGLVYGATAVAMGSLFVWQAYRVWIERSARSARQLFGLSILYLFVVFAALIVDRAERLGAGLF